MMTGYWSERSPALTMVLDQLSYGTALVRVSEMEERSAA
jgi:hypothetical protein